ncbi:AmmeMemoRadiSam system protein B [Candidatus Uhrbacteria bacterium]|nr:AmmeMemoRadiSam system protein B [Candidatus Uhrbacteria bacterium]
MKRTIVILIALSLALAGLLAYRNDDPVEKAIPSSPTSGYTASSTASDDSAIDADKFLVPELYEPSWSAPVGTSLCRPYRGAIVNHHALASDLIVKIVRELARCRPNMKTVIILSPDHYNAGSSSITTHQTSYSTAGDLVAVNAESVDRLLEIPSAGESDSLFNREHGVGVLVPFLHRVLPNVDIVPVVVKASITVDQRKDLVAWIADESRRGNFILVSSDMSQYLDDSIAMKNDERTKRALVDSDSNFFASAKDGFTDNGPSIVATIDALRPRRWHLIDQAISSDYSGSNGFTTTYLVGLWD